jgi:hypothetical protein
LCHHTKKVVNVRQSQTMGCLELPLVSLARIGVQVVAHLLQGG